MFKTTVRNFIEGRGSLASVERAILASKNSQKARAQVEEELALEWALTSSFAAIPAPPQGMRRLKEALKTTPPPVYSNEDSEDLEEVNVALRGEFVRTVEPAGGFAAALERLKQTLAKVEAPQAELQDIAPGFDEVTGRPQLREVIRPKTGTTILRLPRSGAVRDVLAAGKDLPENPDDLPPENE